MRRIVLALLAVFPALAQAQTAHVLPAPSVVPAASIDPTQLGDAELLDLLAQLEALRRARPRRFGIFGIPSGYGVPRGIGFVAAAATNRRDRGRLGDVDASLVFGFGLGDPDRWLGVTPVIDVTSVTPDHFGESGRIGVKLARTLPMPAGWLGSVALDLENLATWGDSRVLEGEANLALTAIRTAGPGTRVPFMLSLGYGSGVAGRGTAPGVFAGLGLGLGSATSVSLAWYGDEAIAGLNFWPVPEKNLQISLGIGDITNQVSGRRLLVAVAFAAPFGRNR